MKRRGAERALLVEVLWLRRADPERLRRLATGPVDWDYVIRTARRRAILPALAWGMRNAGTLSLAPPKVARALELAYYQTALRNRLLLTDLTTITRALQQEGIPSVVLKGGALFASGKVPVGARQTADLDLLIPEGKLAAVTRVLADLGGQRAAPAARPRRYRIAAGATKIDLPDRRDRWTSHEAAVMRVSRNGTKIDLHRWPPGASGAAEAARTFAEAEPVDVDGITVGVPGIARQLCQLSHHVIEQGRIDRWILARHLADACALSDDDGSLPVQRNGGGILDAVALTRWLLAGARDAGSMRSRVIADLLFASSDSRWGAHLELVVSRLLGAAWTGGRVAARDAFPSRRDLASLFGVAERSPWILPLYVYRLMAFPMRPLFESGGYRRA